ncbi:hypothetical protein NOK91_25685 [Vibrio parahaemolyticus]|nr:hypothetical protein [Vibrio parahaemolyticus]
MIKVVCSNFGIALLTP